MIERTGDRAIGLWSGAACCRFSPASLLAPVTAALHCMASKLAEGKAAASSPTPEPDHKIGGLLSTRSSDHPIIRSSVSCFIIVFLFLGGAGLAKPALCDGASEGVISLRSARVASAVGESGESLNDFVHQFESSYHEVRTIRADFTQTFVSGGRTRIESGIVYFARGGLMRWDYEQPQAKLFVSDGKALLLYIPEEKQLTRSPVKASDDIRVPFRLLLSRLELRRVFSRLAFAPDALEHQPADRVLRAYPKQALQDDYQQVVMVITPQFDIRRLLVILPDQSTMEFDFDHIERNTPLSRALFRFTPPPGTEVINEQ